jgi:hypothetical protein
MKTEELVLIGSLIQGSRFMYYGGKNVWIVKENRPLSNEVMAVMEDDPSEKGYTNKKCKVRVVQ